MPDHTGGRVLFELTDAALCANGPVTSPVELSLATEDRRGHGTPYDGLNSGRITSLDSAMWQRPDANTSPQRMFCHTYGRGKSRAQMIRGWRCSFVAAMEPGRSSWTALLDAVRVGPDDDRTDLAAATCWTG